MVRCMEFTTEVGTAEGSRMGNSGCAATKSVVHVHVIPGCHLAVSVR